MEDKKRKFDEINDEESNKKKSETLIRELKKELEKTIFSIYNLNNVFPSKIDIDLMPQYQALLRETNNEFNIYEFMIKIHKKIVDYHTYRIYEFMIPLILEYYSDITKEFNLNKDVIYKNVNINKLLLKIINTIESPNDKYYKSLCQNMFIKYYIDTTILFKINYDLLDEYYQINQELPDKKTVYKEFLIGEWLIAINFRLEFGDINTFDHLLLKPHFFGVIMKQLQNNKLFMKELISEYYNSNTHLEISTTYKTIRIGRWFYNEISKIIYKKDNYYNFLNINKDTENIINTHMETLENEKLHKIEAQELSEIFDESIFSPEFLNKLMNDDYNLLE